MKQLNLNRVFPFLGYSTKNRKASGVTREILFAFMLLLSSSMNGQQNPNAPYVTLLQQSGLGQSVQEFEGYIERGEVFYSLPEGADFMDYDDMEVTQMRPFETGERKIRGNDVNGNPFTVSKVLNPSEQFLPQSLPYDMSIMADGYVEFYASDGDLIHSVFVGIPEIEDPEIPSTGQPQIPGLQIIPLGNGTLYKTADLEIYRDPTIGLIVTTPIDERGVWPFKTISFYDMVDTMRSVPLFEMTVSREELLTGNCVFRADIRKYTDYIRKTKPNQQQPVKMEGEIAASALESIAYYPNPASDAIQVAIPELENISEVTMNLISLDGKTVVQKTLSSNSTHTVELGGQPAGIYLIKFDSNDQSTVNKLIIK